jgi:hypothetical protein
MSGRVSKARKYMDVGSLGLLYCNPTHSFTVPFVVRSKADPHFVEMDIWPEAWVLPFDIEPLGSPDVQLSRGEAERSWPILQRRMPPYTSVSAALIFTGTTVFVPVEVSDAEWGAILADLGYMKSRFAKESP